MGYDTYYSLTVKAPDGWVPLSRERLLQIENRIMEWFEQIMVTDDVLTADGWNKWYDHDDDMAKVSEEFPDALFELYGDGEDSNDFWRTYYFGGALQHGEGRIVYPDLDFNALLSAASDFSEDEMNRQDLQPAGDIDILMGMKGGDGDG